MIVTTRPAATAAATTFAEVTPTREDTLRTLDGYSAALARYSALLESGASTDERNAALQDRCDASRLHANTLNRRNEALGALAPHVTPAHEFGPAFDRAVRVALSHIGIEETIVADEHQQGFVILRVDVPAGGHRFAVATPGEFVSPSEAPLQPWSAPEGVPVARVSMEAVVTLV